MAFAEPGALVAQQQRARMGRRLRSLTVCAGFAIVAAWCVQGTIIADTDWSRIGGAAGVLSSVGRYLQLDLSLAPELIIPTIETFMVACVGTVLGCFFSLPVAWFGARNVTPSRRFLYPVGRFLMVVSRSVHEIVWALIFVSAVGLPGERLRRLSSSNRGRA